MPVLATPTAARPIITLLSDFGTDDWYVAAMKAVLLSRLPDANLVDITNGLPQGDITRGAIALERAVAAFPPRTVHLAVVDPGVGTQRRIVVMQIAQQTVVCPDNGLITWAWRKYANARVYELIWRAPTRSSTFHGRDILAPAAAMIAGGAAVEAIARPIHDPVLLNMSPADEAQPGRIIHFDHFGNAMTNIPASHLREGMRIAVDGRDLGPVRRTYADVGVGEALALVGSSDLLEIAVRDGSAKEKLKLENAMAVELTQPERTYSTAELRELDKRHIWHPFTPMSLWLDDEPLVIAAADGMHLIDTDGNRYLDGVSSLWCNVHGHRVPEIDAAIRRQLDKVAHTTMLGLASESSILLADRLMRIVPQNLKKVFYSDAGATATEIAFKLAVQYWYNSGRPEKSEFIGLAEAYHGDTVGAMSVGRTTAFHKPYFPLLFKVHYAPTPWVYRPPLGLGEGSEFGVQGSGGDAVRDYCLAQMEAVLRQHHARIAAIAIEPVVQGAAGMIVQPDGFLRGVRELADRYDVLLICDEVATGFGRTGRMFACEHEGVEPDLMCAAKGISGGYLPLAATFATQRIFDAFLGTPAEGKTFFHGHTYTGNPLACAAALASLDLFERRNLVRRAAEKAQSLPRMLEDVRNLPHVGDIRHKGMMVGIELVEDKATQRPFDPKRRIGHQICRQIRRHGVLLRPLGDVIVIMPPLVMEERELKRIVAAVAEEVSGL